MLMLRTVFSALVLTLNLPAASAQEEVGRLSLQTIVEKEMRSVDAEGRERTELTPVATAVPGDEVIYTVIFTNTSSESADNVRVTNPIPAQMRYVDHSAFGPGTDVSYSIDDGTTFAAPDTLVVELDDGTTRRATADDYTHIRWTLNGTLDAGARGFARFRAVLR